MGKFHHRRNRGHTDGRSHNFRGLSGRLIRLSALVQVMTKHVGKVRHEIHCHADGTGEDHLRFEFTDVKSCVFGTKLPSVPTLALVTQENTLDDAQAPPVVH